MGERINNFSDTEVNAPLGDKEAEQPQKENFEKEMQEYIDKANEGLNNRSYKLELQEQGGKYYLTEGRIKMKLPFDSTKKEMLKDIIDIVINLLNSPEDLILSGDLHTRDISEDGFLFMNKTVVGSSNFEVRKERDFPSVEDKRYNKNAIEAIFVFIMEIKGVPEKDWDISGPICKGAISDCIKFLGHNE